MLFKEEQPWNAEEPMFVTEFGMLMVVRLEEAQNASPAIPFVPSFSVMVPSGMVPLYP